MPGYVRWPRISRIEWRTFKRGHRDLAKDRFARQRLKLRSQLESGSRGISRPYAVSIAYLHLLGATEKLHSCARCLRLPRIRPGMARRPLCRTERGSVGSAPCAASLEHQHTGHMEKETHMSDEQS